MKKYLYPAGWLLLVLGINLYFRVFPVYFPQLKTQANAMLDDAIRQGAIKEVMQRFPQYDPLAKDRLVKEKTAEYKKLKKQEVNQQREELYKKLKDRYQDDRGQTYLMELDCWHWARYVKNVFYLGRPGDEVRGGKQIDTFMLAPTGMEISWDRFLFYFSAAAYKIFILFNYVPLFDFVFYLPLFFTTLFISALFFFSFKHGRYFGAIISCLFIGLTPNFIPRSCAGWFDKDILNMLFPILVIWSYLSAFPVRQTKKRLLLICLAGFWEGLFCFTWPYWWFVFLIIVFYEAATCAVMLFLRLQYKKENVQLLKQHILSVSAFAIFSVFWIIVFCGFEPFSVLYRLLRDAITLSKPVAVSLWPNVYSTVGELKKSDFKEVINSLGGGLIFFSSLFSLFFILIRNLFVRKDEGFKSQSIIVLFIWFVSMLYACFKGVRFVVFLGVPLGISLGWMVNDIYQYFISRNMLKRGRLGVTCLAILFTLPFVITADKVSKGIYPLINDPWYKVLNILQQATPKDTVINSWWDFGDWFKVIAQRKVIFDGQSQNGPQAYWMAKALLTSNEEESLTILRMLNNGGNKAFEIIDSYLNDPLRSMLLLESIIPLESSKAREKLSDFLPASKVGWP